ncbi:hypothetical protein NUW54_g6030 [Trametes sanguinea]|uniref:Uncharacterized protein n=1 Tax=Trametes sanguinea TaxID=158606 RepID=A0ACC1PWS1_9APHY|nr:hypothetical protein NUW54_g6030 [Trametes sanguinea]
MTRHGASWTGMVEHLSGLPRTTRHSLSINSPPQLQGTAEENWTRAPAASLGWDRRQAGRPPPLPWGCTTVVVRLGQVCGDRVGHWNEKEWFPALVKSAQINRRLPELESNVSWVPGYEGAKAFAEVRQSPYPFLHLVHPRPVPWSTIIAPIAEELRIPHVSYQDCLTTLQQMADVPDGDHCGEQVKENPALRLVDFFSGLETSSSRKPLGTVNLSTENATRVSATLHSLPPLDIGQVQAWLAAWKRSGFLE